MNGSVNGDISEFYKARGKCCISGRSMKDSKHINIIQTDYKAVWDYPKCGNILTGLQGLATAIVHDDWIDTRSGKIKGQLKWCVEFDLVNDEIIYHPVEQLEIHENFKQ